MSAFQHNAFQPNAFQGERSSLFLNAAVSDPLLTGLTETAVLTRINLVASDTLALTVSDPDITAFELTGLTDPFPAFAETSALDTGGGITPIVGADTLLGLAEAVTVRAFIPTSDVWAAGLTDTATASATVSTSDTFAAGLTDTAGTLVISVSTADIVTCGVTENLVLAISFATSDTLVIGLTDSTTPAITLSTSDVFTTGLTDTANSSVTLTTSDSLRTVIDDLDILAIELTGLTDAFPAFTDTSTLDAGGAIQITSSDVLITGVTESSTVFVRLSVSDTLMQVVEDLLIKKSESVSDSLPGFVESASVVQLSAGIIATSDALTVGLTEAVTLVATLSISDTLTGLAESATKLDLSATVITTSDSLSLTLGERAIRSDGTLFALFTSDAIRVTIADLDIKDIFLNNDPDPLRLGLTETASVVIDAVTFVTKTGTDSITVGLVEPYVFEQQLASAENMQVRITESTAVVDLTGGITSITDDDFVLRIGLTETLTAKGLVTVSDALSGLTEQSTLETAGGIEKTASDTLTVNIYPDFPTTGVLDTFTRTDENPLASGPWQAFLLGTSRGQLLSNAITHTLSTSFSNAWNAVPSSDQEIYLTVTTRPNVSGNVSLFVRANNLNSAVENGYICQYTRTTWTLSVFTGGSAAATLASGALSLSDGDAIGLRITGITLSVYHQPIAGAWTRLGSATSTTYATGTIGFYALDTATGTVLDNLGGGLYVPFEQSTLAVRISVSDTAPGLTETVATRLSMRVDELLSGLGENINIVPIIPISAADAIDNIFNVILAENANIVDLSGGLSTHSDTETLPAFLNEAALTRAFQPVSDVEALGLTEAAAVAVVIAGADTLVVQLTDTSGAGALVLLRVDDLLAKLAEDVTNYLRTSVEETVGGLLSDLYRQLQGQVATDDLLILGLTETRTIQDVTDLLTKSGADSLRLGMTETAVIESVSLLGGQIIVTTVEYLGRKRAILGNGPLTVTVDTMPKQAQLSEV
jgi:hypothetical protein